MSHSRSILVVFDHTMNTLGGAQTAIMNQLRALVSDGHRVVLVAPGVDAVRDIAGVVGVEPPKPLWNIKEFEFPIYKISAKLEKVFAQLHEVHNFDAFIAHSEGGLSATAMRFAKTNNIHYAYFVHSFFLEVPWNPPIPKWFYAAVFRWLTGLRYPGMSLAARGGDNFLQNFVLGMALAAPVVISPSAHQAEKLRAAGVPKVQVISNIYEAEVVPTKAPSSEGLLLAWAGRLAPEKRLDVALEAVRIANEQLGAQRVRITVAGGAANQAGNEEARALVQANPAAEFVGRITPAQVSQMISEAHALLLTSNGFDNQPMVILEAIAQKRAVVLCDATIGAEFAPATIVTESPSAEGIAATLVSLVQDRSRLNDAVKATEVVASRSAAATHFAALLKLLG